MKNEVPLLEEEMGIETYMTGVEGIDGRIKSIPEDFVVEEVSVDGFETTVSSNSIRPIRKGHGRYLICILIKKKWDTFIAIKYIAEQLGINRRRIGIAGIKDANALTSQFISIAGFPAGKVLDMNLNGIKVIPVFFSSERMTSRFLFGNKFSVLVRSINLQKSDLESRLKRAKQELSLIGGFPNFFGHQRFGTIRPVTHKIGYNLLKRNFKAAVQVLLGEPSSNENPQSRFAREFFLKTQNCASSLKYFPSYLEYEKIVLRYLSICPRDFLGAFCQLPREIVTFYIQSFQSYLFNRFLSKRLALGIPITQASVGDYVSYLDKRGIPLAGYEEVKSSNMNRLNKAIKEGKMSVSLPLIGYRQHSSGGLQGDIEKGILEEEGISNRDFHIKEIPMVSSAGCLRQALAPFYDLSIGDNLPQIRFSFRLQRGSYATILLREFMKPRDLVGSGF